MRKATKENMAAIISIITKDIEIGKLVPMRELAKKVEISSPDFLENILQSILAYHLADVNSMLQRMEKQKVLDYAEKIIVPQVESVKGMGAVVKKVPLINVMRENAMKRSQTVEDYFKDKEFMLEPEEELIA